MASRPIDRRTFLHTAGKAVAAAVLLSGCESDSQTEHVYFRDSFAGGGGDWDDGWLKIRYQGSWERKGDAAIIRVGPAPSQAVRDDLRQIEYLGEPVVVLGSESSDTRVACEVQVLGPVEAGVMARWDYERAYALLVTEDEALLCRYDDAGRRVLDSAPVKTSDGWARLELLVRGGDLEATVSRGGEEVALAASDDRPLPAGLAGVAVNAVTARRGAEGRFRHFRAGSFDPPRLPLPRFAYRFAGALVPDGHGFKARVTARTVIPQEISFEYSTSDDFARARSVGPNPAGPGLGSVHAWLHDLAPDTEYFWRPLAGNEGRVTTGPVARFRTPPPPGSPVVFAFGSCTPGRSPSYPSFEVARSHEPAFYLHAGDWGYVNLTSQDHRGDHFQLGWARMLRVPQIAALLDQSRLMFWQDDHDYQANNGWSGTCKPYAVKAFDQLHANPTDVYFDVRHGDAHVWCLDCRLFASDPEAPDDAAKTRLGFEQKAWLKRGMAASDAPVRIVASAMAFRDKVDKDPGWHNVYTTERDELLEFFSSLDATVVILSGDSHGQRLIHHFEFGDLWEITSSGTDFYGPTFGQGLNDPRHTKVYKGEPAFALAELDAGGPHRRLTISCIRSEDDSVLFRKSLPVRSS